MDTLNAQARGCLHNVEKSARSTCADFYNHALRHPFSLGVSRKPDCQFFTCGTGFPLNAGPRRGFIPLCFLSLMAVFTEVSPQEAAALLSTLGLGTLQSLQGCASGIENTNYFASTDQGDYVLTLFERLSFEQLPFYLNLMHHLAQRGIPVPAPQANAQGEILHTLKGKPAAVVTRLKGRNQLSPQVADCAQVGAMLARMHQAGTDYPHQQPNLRGLAWWTETIPVVRPHLNA